MFSKEVSEALDVIVNATPEELKEEFEQHSLGDLTNFIQRLTMIYEIQTKTKDSILLDIKENKTSSKDAEKTLNNLYLYMQKIEDTVTVLKSIKDEKLKMSNK